MIGRTAAITLSALLSAGCVMPTGIPDPSGEAPPHGQGRCAAEPVQKYIGQRLTDTLSVTIREESGATLLRVGGPGAIWTMDFREERVNITFDEGEIIERITCG